MIDMQAGHATAIVFRSAATLAPLYDHLLRTAILAVKVSDVATFLGRSPNRPTDREAGSDFSSIEAREHASNISLMTLDQVRHRPTIRRSWRADLPLWFEATPG